MNLFRKMLRFVLCAAVRQRSQAQSRATIQAVVDLKFPRQATFVKQANIANGPQQINNKARPEIEPVRAGTHARTGKTERMQNELLEHQHGNYLDTGAQGTAGALIRTWKPWAQASGPRTPEGKAKASRNAWSGGRWLKMRELTKMVNSEIRQARELVERCR